MNIQTTYGLMDTITKKLLSISAHPQHYEHDNTTINEYELENYFGFESKSWEAEFLFQACIAKEHGLNKNSEFYQYPECSRNLRELSVVVAIHKLDNGLTYLDENVPQSLDEIFGDFDNLLFLASHDIITGKIDKSFNFQTKHFTTKKMMNEFKISQAHKAWINLCSKKEEPKIVADLAVFRSLLEESLQQLKG